MAGGHMKYRTLSRSSAHRQALLRNLVTALFKHESITTTWHKAKEAQRLAEKLVTLGKRNTQAAKDKAESIFFEHKLVPKLFSTIRERYATRPGGYTRVLRIEPKREDQAASAILELVDSPVDTRFAMTARAVAAERAGIRPASEVTEGNKIKATRFRGPGAEKEFENMVKRFEQLDMKRKWAEGEREKWEDWEEAQRWDANGVEAGGKKPKGRREGWEKWIVDGRRVERKERVYPDLERSRL
ncbi:50S ribosomal protein L17 [Myriangium duriaei CBS 260.36]|uniref:Large ribosomal subunit protein bL17m n=1 Tax=Myriangium duriaei CBS 260.36 TaxID=1168546 RepID=A0A9P4J232_9PEZI|nr:50S ribosomal protein L17 [Myriangium duriaei CBS 260.36]